MGLDQKVVCDPGKIPSWKDVAPLLSQKQCPAQMRMIDGQLAFPDEEPEENWKELRISIDGNMITLKREADGVRLVIWGNAEPGFMRAWNLTTWTFAHLSGGMIQSGAESMDVDHFAERNHLS